METRESQISSFSLELRESVQKYSWSSDSLIPRIQVILRTLTFDGQPTLMTGHGMADIDLGSVEGRCILLLGLFILSGPGEETSIGIFKLAFESLEISPGGQFRSFLKRILPGQEIGAVWNDE
jgi:hypothetical protein